MQKLKSSKTIKVIINIKPIADYAIYNEYGH